MNRNSLFFLLLRDALWQRNEPIPSELSESEMESLLSLAEKQAVSGLISDSLIRHDVKLPQMQVYELIGLQNCIKQNSLKINKGAKELHLLFERNHVKYVIVKGQVVASYYPEPLLRQSGDVDYYCDSHNFDYSLKAVRDSWGVVAETDDSEYHAHFDYKDVTFEGHFALALFFNNRKDNYWQQILDNDKGDIVNIDGVGVRTLSPTLHVLFVYLHLFHHLVGLGVGFRQLCDWAVMLHYANSHINQEQLQMHLKALGMESFYRACGSILVDYLGLPENEFGYTITSKDRKYGKKILDIILYRGNFGQYNKRNGFSGWKHKVEASIIKISHFIKFVLLIPDYSFRWIWHEFKIKVI